MKADAYMPYFGGDFEGAMKGYCRAVKWSYLAALWHYWHHTHCAGLADEDESLRLICECPETEWMRTKGVIFCGQPFFHLESGKWHQDHNRELYSEVMDTLAKRVAASRAGVAKRVELGQIQPPDEPMDEPSDNPSVNLVKVKSKPKPKSQSQSQSHLV